MFDVIFATLILGAVAAIDNTLMQLGGIMVIVTPVITQLIKKFIPQDWRSTIPLILGALAGVTWALQTGLEPWSMEGLKTIMAGMGGASAGQSVREIRKRGPIKKKPNSGVADPGVVGGKRAAVEDEDDGNPD